MFRPSTGSTVIRPTALAAAVALASSAQAQMPGQMEELVVTASGHEQNIADAPASISSVSGEELQKKSYTNITDAMKNVPGVFVTGGGNSQDISIRGMGEEYTLYLIDGRRVSAGRNINTNGNDGGKQIVLPPASMIERVEVIRGPMSSLYGSDAMGGVVNIITKDSTGEWSGELATEYTKSFSDLNEDSRQTTAAAGGAIIPGLLGLQLNGSIRDTEESTFIGGTDNAESTPESTRKQGSAELTLTPDSTNTFDLSYSRAELDYTHRPGVSIPLQGRRGPNETTNYSYRKTVYQAGHEGTYGDLTVDSYIQHDVSERARLLEEKREQITTFNNRTTYLAGEHLITFGGQYKYEDLTDQTNGLLDTNVPAATDNVSRWIGALFAEVEWRVARNLNVTTGLRYNDDELFGGHWTPRAYANYRLTPQWTLKGGVSTGYKQPSLPSATEGFGRPTGGPGSPAPHSRALIIGNENLDPETSTNYELGFVFNNADRSLNVSTMLFRTEFDDKIAEDRYCVSGPYDEISEQPDQWNCSYQGNDYLFLSTRKNIDEAIMQGVEMTMDYRFTEGLTLSSSYTYTESEQQTGEFEGEPLNKIPRHMFNAGIDWQATSLLNIWADTNIRGETSDYLGRTSMSGGTPGYGFVDAGLTYQINEDARFKAGLYNIGDKEVTNDTYGVVLDGRRMNVGLTVNF